MSRNRRLRVRMGELRRFLRETDLRMVGDDKGSGIDDPEGDDMSDHLKTDKESINLGSPVRESVWLNAELRSFFLQEAQAETDGEDDTLDGDDASTGAPGDAANTGAAAPEGFYTPFDMTRDHTGTDDLSATWYRSPGRAMGTDGDPFRSEDPYAQLGFHPPQGQSDPTAAPPGVSGEEGTAARLAPPIWQLSAGSNTSKVLGANAKADSGGVGSMNGQGSSQAGEAGSEEAEDEIEPGANKGKGQK